MTNRVLSLSLTLFLAGAGSAAAVTPAEGGFVVPEGSFVLDGGEIEAASIAKGRPR